MRPFPVRWCGGGQLPLIRKACADMDTTGARQWWAVGVGVVPGSGSGSPARPSRSAATRPVYASTASVLVQQIGSTAPILPTEAQLAQSTRTATDAARRVGRSTEDLAAATTVEPLAGSSVLLITVRAGSPAAAQAGAPRRRRRVPHQPRRDGPRGDPGPGDRADHPHLRHVPAGGGAERAAGPAAGELPRAGRPAELGQRARLPADRPVDPADRPADHAGRPGPGHRRPDAAHRRRLAPAVAVRGRSGRAPARCSACWPALGRRRFTSRVRDGADIRGAGSPYSRTW